jgi:hypothetical protein
MKRIGLWTPLARPARQCWALALLIIAAFGLAACGGGGSGGAATGATGIVNIGLTDAPGDFLSYTIDVTSLTLTKANGTVVETLPQKTRIDFAQYAELTEFLTGATVPAGDYVSATLHADFTNAEIAVDDGSGKPVVVAPADIRDTQGNPVTTLSMTVKLDDAHHLVIVPGVPALLDLDFHLAASNLVDMSNPARPVVTVTPVLLADVDPDLSKPHRIRGPLGSVDTQAGSFTLVLRPFHLLTGDFGRVTFRTDSLTAYEVNQASYTGSAGLAALAQQPRFTATVALGAIDPATHQFVATEVYAGSSVAFGTRDVVTGNVIARSGDVLTIKGAALARSSGTITFRDTVSVTLDPATTQVTAQTLAGTSLDTNSISVGQRVTVLGTLDAAGASMDAANGLVRMLITQLNGTVGSVAGGGLAMTLDRINGRPIGLFNFSGTGEMGGESNPNAYQVVTGTLDLTGITTGTPLKVRGFVQPFGQATASDDFHALTLINITQAPATLVVGWPTPTPAPFSRYAATGLAVDLTSAGTVHDIYRAGVDTPLALTDAPFVQAIDPLHGRFAIAANGSVQLYTQLANYQQALQAELLAGRRARGFAATGGTYDDPSQTLMTNAMVTVLQ